MYTLTGKIEDHYGICTWEKSSGKDRNGELDSGIVGRGVIQRGPISSIVLNLQYAEVKNDDIAIEGYRRKNISRRENS
jgi:hypothetical protein